MSTIPERLEKLRAKMQEKGIDIYIIPTADFHQSEYVGEHFKAREYITGFTGSAGYCYVGALERDGKLLIVALLGCGWPGNKTYKWADTKKLMNYGLTNYQEHVVTDDILQKNKIPFLSDSAYGTVKDEDIEAVGWECHFSETLLLRADEQISVKYLLPEYLKCPIYAGMQAGSVMLSIDGKAFAIYPVTITENVQSESMHDFMKEYVKDYIGRNFS